MSVSTDLPNFYREQLEPYWFDSADVLAESGAGLDQRIQSIPAGKSFIFLTDPHRREGLGNRMRSPALIGYIRAVTGIRTTLLGGDYIGRLPQKEMAMEEMQSYLHEMKSVCGEDLLVAPGNHDRNTANVPPDLWQQHIIPYEQLDRILFGHLKNRKLEDCRERIAGIDCSQQVRRELLYHSRLHYYWDDTELKLRYIILDTGFGKIGNCAYESYGVSQMDQIYLQFDWLYTVLSSAPADYDVVIFGHYLYAWAQKRLSEPAVQLCKMVSGFRTASVVTVQTGYPKEHRLNTFYSSGIHTYDFTARKATGKVVILGGDTHWDTCEVADYDDFGHFVAVPYHGEKLSDSAVVISGLQSDAYGCVNYYEEAFHMEPGTRTEQCFDVVTLCSDGNVRMTRFGAGKDRIIRFL